MSVFGGKKGHRYVAFIPDPFCHDCDKYLGAIEGMVIMLPLELVNSRVGWAH